MMWSEFPLLMAVGVDSTPKAFHGFIKLDDLDHEVWLDVPSFPSCRNVNIRGDAYVMAAIHKCGLLQMATDDNLSILIFLKKLQQYCASRVPFCEWHPDIGLSLAQVCHELDSLGWSRVQEISSDFSDISLQVNDDSERIHTMNIKLSKFYPVDAPQVNADLPVELEVTWSQTDGLLGLVRHWEQKLAELQDFWNVLDELDANTLVLEPQHVLRKHSTRRILLGNHVSLQLSLSISHPRAFPQCHFLGPNQFTEPLNALLSERFEEWDTSLSVVSNLESILEVEFVRRKQQMENPSPSYDDYGLECVVCYSLRLDEQLPDVTCDHCSHSFHLQCLYEWLRSVPNSRQSMSYLFGECPYCSKIISCKMPSG